ncbi:hypothetical protein [Bacillus smithii]|uniref:hypothetical protein n=1 Tax=Bacillus smithii TaxID=1479 RepID=UPI002E1D333E|nr:hypothetical protein [Bacillus smithii]MED4928258.1 hypothetical protein [Bacillus smithii]
MKPLWVNKEGIINRGVLKGFKGTVVGFDSETDKAKIKLDNETIVNLSSEMIDQDEEKQSINSKDFVSISLTREQWEEIYQWYVFNDCEFTLSDFEHEAAQKIKETLNNIR